MYISPIRSMIAATLTAGALFGSAACGSDAGQPEAKAPRADATGTITVLGASSLTKPFTAFAKDFEKGHPGTHVQLSFGSSTDLAGQVLQGAPADVFASADQKNMGRVTKGSLNASTPVDFAANELTIAVAMGNPKRIASVADLRRDGLVVLLCDAAVPCGKFADQVLANANVALMPTSREASARVTITKLELGEADAAIVYASDVASSGQVEMVKIPKNVNVKTTLPITVIK